MDAPKLELLTAFASLYDTGKYSDLTIKCNERTFAVHKAVICSRSGFFDGACSHPFREAESGIIDLSADDDEAVEHMIHYFYHLDYLSKARSRRTSQLSSPTTMTPISPFRQALRRPVKLNLALVEDPLLAQAQAANNLAQAPGTPLTPPQDRSLDYFNSIDAKIPPSEYLRGDVGDDPDGLSSCESDTEDDDCDATQPHLVIHAKVYAIAEKYGITGLKALAKRKYAAQLDEHWQNPEFAESIQEVYETTVDTDRGLRDLVIHTFREHPELARSNDVELVVKDTPGIAWELFRLGWGMPVC